MNFNSLFLLAILFTACKNEPASNKAQPESDTIYAYHRKDYQNSLPIIQISSNTYLNFKIDQTDTVRIMIKNFSEYQTELRNYENVKIEKLDQYIYLVTPLDSSFTMEIWQNYDSGRVVRKIVDKEGRSYHINYDGWQLIGKEIFSAK